VGFWDLGGYPCFSMILGFWGFLWISLNLWVFEWMNLWLNEWFDFDFHLFVLFFDWRIFFWIVWMMFFTVVGCVVIIHVFECMKGMILLYIYIDIYIYVWFFVTHPKMWQFVCKCV
jgi:hypothetical protein